MLADFSGNLLHPDQREQVGQQFSEYWVVLSKVLPNAYLGEPPSKWLVMHALGCHRAPWFGALPHR